MALKKIQLLLTLVLVIISTSVCAKDFIVKGKIVNEKTDKSIAGAEVVFKNLKKPDKYIYVMTTTEDGYSHDDMKYTSSKSGNDYKVEVKAEGYEDLTETINFQYSKAGFVEIPNFKMKPKSVPATIKGKVVSKKSSGPLKNAQIKINDTDLTTDDKGEFTLKVEQMFFFTPLGLNITIERFGYQKGEFKKSLLVKPSETAEFTIEDLPLASDDVEIHFKGTVKNFFGGANTEGAEVSINGVAGPTATDGTYHIKGLKINYEESAEYKFKITKVGYLPLEKTLSFTYPAEGVANVEEFKLQHEDLQAPKISLPEKTAFALRPKFAWQLPTEIEGEIDAVKIMTSTDKDFKENVQSLELKGALTEVKYPDVSQPRLLPETTYFVKITYLLKRSQESLAAEHSFETAAMQYTQAPVGSSPFTTGESQDISPSWGQDGKTVYFSSNLTEYTTDIFEIWSKRTDRVGQTKLSSSMQKSNDIRPSSGPGPDMVSYLSNRIGVLNIWSVPTGENQNRLPMQRTSFDKEHIRWISCSRDGKKIVYCRDKKVSKKNTEDLEIWLLNTNDNSTTLLSIQGTMVKISPDSEKVLYVTDKQGSPDIWMLDLMTGSNKQIVSDADVIDTDPAWTKDGGSIVYASNKTGNFDLWLLNIRNGKIRPLTNSLADERYPDCNPVTNELVYCSDETGKMKLRKLEIPEE